jgi:uncharacterized protein YecT (DUF1311 family)
MKALLLSLICWVLLISGDAQDQVKSTKCYDTAQTQTGLNECAGADLAKADRELNRTYQLILEKYAKDSLFLQRLEQAQRAWLAFRDAEIEMKYPGANARELTARYGTVYPMCFASYKAELTEQRTRELSAWLKGIEEGDVCSGSVKTPEELK